MKSIGHEETFSRDHHLRSTLDHELVQFADAVASRLRAQGLVARTIQLKVRFGDFTTITRSTTLAVAVDDSRSLLEAGRLLLELVDPAQGVRLLGLSVSGLSSDSSKQLTFDEATAGPGWQEADRTIDEIRARFGDGAIGPAISAGPDGLRLKRRGNQQWGPDAETT
jgi:DNA polymerase-4